MEIDYSTALALFTSEHIYRENGQYYTTQSKLDTFTLQCDPFENVTLCAPVSENILKDMKLIRLPKTYKVLPLYEQNHQGFIKRIKKSLQTAIKFVRYHNNWNIIYVRLFFWDGLIAGVLSIILRKRMFVSLHGDIEESILINWQEKKLPQGLIYIMSKLLKFLTSWISNNGELLFVSGPALAEKYTPKRNDTIPFLDSGYSLKDIFLRDDTCNNESITLLYVGELVERKGIKYLLESVKMMFEEGNNIILNIVGEGDKQKYENMVSELCIDDIVFFKGYKSFGPELFNEFKKADIFILPSIGTEGWSRVLIEANAHSLPIVTTEVGSLGHAARECNCGLVADVKSSESLTENILKVIHEEELRKKLVKGSIKRAKKHTKENERKLVWKKLQEVYPQYVKRYKQ